MFSPVVEFSAMCLTVPLTFLPPTTSHKLGKTPPPDTSEVVYSTSITFPGQVKIQSGTPVPVTQPPNGT